MTTSKAAMRKEARKSLADLLAVMAALRTPGTGCPWDLQQTFKTIAPYTIEEAYEVADAIETADMAALKDELGDLLFQVVYHARMAEEEGAFAFADVVDAITDKMIRRHPHVFGSAAERAAGAGPGFWERIKAAERADKPAGVLDDVPAALPGLTRAVKLQDKAAEVGFDWPSLAPVFDKLKEELAELEQAVAAGGGRQRSSHADQAKVTEEFGDLLFVVANVARHLKIDPEASLRAANQKFIRRFRRIEELLAAQGRTPAQSNLAEMDRLWDQAKAEERSAPSPRERGGRDYFAPRTGQTRVASQTVKGEPSMAELEIIGVPQSNYVWVVRIAATEKGVPYKLTPVRPNAPEVGAIHPFSKIPVMRHGDIELFESKAICTYIDRAFQGPALMPADAKGYAEAEQWISCVNTLIDPTCVRQYIVSYAFPGTPDGSPNRPKIDAALPAMEKQLSVLDKALAKTGHLVGDKLTLADINLFPIAFYLQRFPESKAMVQGHKHLTGFIERMLARPSVKATTPPPPPKKE